MQRRGSNRGGRGGRGGFNGGRGGRGNGRVQYGRGPSAKPRPISEWTKLVMGDFAPAVHKSMEDIRDVPNKHDILFIDLPQLTATVLQRSGEACCDGDGTLNDEYFNVLIDTLTEMIMEFPARNVYIGNNGQSPYAKLHTTRKRVLERIEERRDLPTSFLEHHPDSPTNTSRRLKERIEEFHKRNIVPWAKCNVYIDSQQNPGTCLFKFSRFIHENLENGSLRHGFSLVIISSGYDMMTMALATHEPNIYIVRNHDTAERSKLNIVSIKQVREIIAKIFHGVERSIDDFLFMMFLTGGVFVPGIAEFRDIKECYMRLKEANPGKWLVNNGEMDVSTMELLLRELAARGMGREGAVDIGEDDAKSVLAGYDWLATYFFAGCPDWTWYCTAMDSIPSVRSLYRSIRNYRRNFDRKAKILGGLTQLMLRNGMRNRPDLPPVFRAVAKNANYRKYFEFGPNKRVYDMPPSVAQALYNAIESQVDPKVREIRNICERTVISRTGVYQEKVDPYKHTIFRSSEDPVIGRKTTMGGMEYAPVEVEPELPVRRVKKVVPVELEPELPVQKVKKVLPVEERAKSGRVEPRNEHMPDVLNIFGDIHTYEDRSVSSDGGNDSEYDDDRSDGLIGEYSDEL